MMEQQKSITELENAIVSEMEKQMYAPETIRIFRSTCKKFRNYAIQIQGTDVFSETISDRFLKDLFDYPLQERRPLTNTERNAVRCTRWIGEYNSFGGFTRLAAYNKIPLDIWGMDDVEQIRMFVNGLQTPDNSEKTKETRLQYMHAFYLFLSAQKITGVKMINAQVVSAYVSSLQGYASTTIKHRTSALRKYFRYVHGIGYCDKDWSYSVPIIRRPQNVNIPALWSDEEIILMLKTIDRSSPIGKRDYAILLLGTQLGLRITDVSELKYSSLDWKTKTLNFVQHKTSGSNNNLPISLDLGWAIIDYSQYGRPESELPYVFLSGNAPYRQMAPHSVGDILRRAMSNAGLAKRPLITSGMHSLRHALARKLLNEGVSLTEIANIMGHANYNSTSPYLNVDIDGLRKCCLSLGGDLIASQTTN